MATDVSRGTMPAAETVGTPTMWAIGGLVVAILGGMIGSFFETGDTQAILYSLGTAGGMVAGLLLAVRHGRARLDLSAAGFGALGVLSAVGVMGGYTGQGNEIASGLIAVMHWPAVWLIASQNWAPMWSRAAAAVAGLLFALWGYGFVLGGELDVDSPLAIAGWIAFAVAAAGWVMTLLAEGDGGSGGARA